MKRRYMVGVPLWNCLDMVPWIIEGVVKGFDPSRTSLVFLFSNTPSEVRDAFHKQAHELDDFSTTLMSTSDDLWEGQNHNILMRWFLNNTSDDVLICPQDDHHWNSNRICDDLDAVFDKYGDRVGVIGGRDGYGYFFDGMVGSMYSDSINIYRRLENGESAESIIVNPGPFVYSRHTIRAVGYNEDMPIYAFEDYCLRCNQAGKVNLCMGMDVLHKKFGRRREMCNHGPKVANDLARLQAKWIPILGHPVH